jgi:hypothetical protein
MDEANGTPLSSATAWWRCWVAAAWVGCGGRMTPLRSDDEPQPQGVLYCMAIACPTLSRINYHF